MARILLIAALVVVGFVVLGSVLGLVFTVLKWLAIVGAIALVVSVAAGLGRSGGRRSDRIT